MSTAKLNVWITEMGRPCTIENIKTLYVYVLRCDGTVLEWCGRKYWRMPTKCGHLEVEIPPGCYVVGAVENPFTWYTPFGNQLTHLAIVHADCGDEVCVTLFNPSLHHCGSWLQAAVNHHLDAPGQTLPAEIARAMKNAAQAVDGLVKAIPPEPFATQLKGLEVIPKPVAGSAKSSKRGGKSGGK